MPKQHKVNIFQVLDKLDRKDTEVYQSLSEEEQKALHPLVVMRWMSCVNDPRQIVFLNELVNDMVFNVPGHKDLMFKLMTICSSGNTKRRKWVKAPSKKSSAKPVTNMVIRESYGYNTKQADEAIGLMTDSVILECAEYLGRQPNEIKEIKKELKKR